MPHQIEGFCLHLLRKGLAGRATHDELATEFVRYFGLSVYPRLEHLRSMLERSTTIGVQAARLPGLRCFHFTLGDGNPTILYEEDQWAGAQEHTILHELYEVMQEQLERQSSDFRAPRGRSLCRAADRFAAAVLLQADVFRAFLLATGFDLLAVSRSFRRSYSSVIYRTKEVLGNELDFVIALYERTTPGDPQEWPTSVGPEEFRVGHLVRTAGFRLARPRVLAPPAGYLRYSLPVRRGRVHRGSSVERVIRTGQPVLVDRTPESDAVGIGSLTALARPVRWHGKLAKVMLVAIPHRDRELLRPQLAAIGADLRTSSYLTI